MATDKLRILAIGAHPDDCEFRCGGVAALWAARGHQVCFLSMTNGGAGHHEVAGAQLVQRRIAEARAAAAVIGIQSRVLPIPDGLLEPLLEHRLTLIRAIREFQADMLITNRPTDYHPDHRYTSQLVQDSAFMLTVPHVVPDTPPLRRNPVILYWFDAFTKPLPFHADLAIDIDGVFDTKMAMLHQHQSQIYEWLPWLEGTLAQVPPDEAGRREFLKQWYIGRRKSSIADAVRAQLVARYGPSRGQAVHHAEAFEVCEYGAGLDQQQSDRFFGGL